MLPPIPKQWLTAFSSAEMVRLFRYAILSFILGFVYKSMPAYSFHPPIQHGGQGFYFVLLAIFIACFNSS